MKNNLLVAVIGNRKSGKSYTWNELFGREVRTGSQTRFLNLSENEYVSVFLISGSPEERGIDVEDIITVENPRIVLCSFQYVEKAKNNLKYFMNKDYFIFAQWLNPGYKDSDFIDDSLNFVDYIIFQKTDSLFGLRNGKVSAKSRVQEIKDFIYGWAKSRNLLFTL